jgi:hypothetical protein
LKGLDQEISFYMSQADVGLHCGFNIAETQVKTGELEPYGFM